MTLTIEEARKEASTHMAVHGEYGMAMRSCWNCNSAHEHLKSAEYVICCFSCGGYFWKGVDITEWEADEG